MYLGGFLFLHFNNLIHVLAIYLYRLVIGVSELYIRPITRFYFFASLGQGGNDGTRSSRNNGVTLLGFVVICSAVVIIIGVADLYLFRGFGYVVDRSPNRRLDHFVSFICFDVVVSFVVMILFFLPAIINNTHHDGCCDHGGHKITPGMPDGSPVKGSVRVIVIRSVAIESPAAISVRGPCIAHGTRPYVGVSPVDIDVPAVVDIYIGIPPAAVIDIYPVVRVSVASAIPCITTSVPGSGDIGGFVP